MTCTPPRSPNSDMTEANRPSLARSLVGRVPVPGGTAIRRPPATPAMTRVTTPVCQAKGLLPATARGSAVFSAAYREQPQGLNPSHSAGGEAVLAKSPRGGKSRSATRRRRALP